MDLSNKLDQIETFQNYRHRKQHDMALVPLVIRNTIDEISLVEFEQVECSIWVNIVDFYFFHGTKFQHQISPNWAFLRILDTENDIMALVALVISTVASLGMVSPRA